MTGTRRLFVSLVLGCCLSTSLFYAQNNTQHWQEAKTISGNFKAISSLPDLEVFSAPNTIMLKVNREVEIRLFTILGKLISVERLEPGIFIYRIDSHGIYIIKTTDSSCKIAI